jgi:hypothetical protein
MNLEVFRPIIAITFRVHIGAYRQHSSFAPADGEIGVIDPACIADIITLCKKGLATTANPLKRSQDLIFNT